MHRAGAVALLLVVAVALAAFQRGQAGRLRDAVAANCASQNETRAELVTYIVGQLNAAEKSLHKIEYYRRHPRELVEAVRRIENQRRDTRKAFAPRPCS